MAKTSKKDTIIFQCELLHTIYKMQSLFEAVIERAERLMADPNISASTQVHATFTGAFLRASAEILDRAIDEADCLEMGYEDEDDKLLTQVTESLETSDPILPGNQYISRYQGGATPL